jgi:hypothetical protein
LLFFLYWDITKKLIVGSNANNGGEASLGTFNSINGVGYAGSLVGFLYFQIHLF